MKPINASKWLLKHEASLRQGYVSSVPFNFIPFGVYSFWSLSLAFTYQRRARV